MKKLTRELLLTLVTAGLVLSSASLSLAQGNGYGSTTINVPGAVAADARGINDSGQVVGRYIDGSGNTHGFLYSSGSVTTIDCTGATLTEANGINTSGQIVGDYIDTSLATHGFLLNSGGACTAIDDPEANSYTKAFGINDSNQVVGEYIDSGGTQHGFLWDGSNYTAIDYTTSAVPSALGTLANGIDQAGHIVGDYIDTSSVTHGFLYSHGYYFTIDSCGSSAATLPRGMNAAGEIVGECVQSGSGGATDGFLSVGGVFTTIDLSGYAGADELSGINDSGQMVGGAGPYASGEVAFLMTPGNLLQTTEYTLPLPSPLPPSFEIVGESTPVLGRDSIGYYVVYTLFPIVNGVDGNSSIFYQRLDASGQPTGSPVVVADSSENQYLNNASGDYIVYTLGPSLGMPGNIVLFQISTSQSQALTTTGDCISPKIDGNYVIWLEELAVGTQVVMYWIPTGVPVQTTVIGGPTPTVGDADVGDRYFAWSQLVNNQYEVADYDMEQGASFLASSNSLLNEQNVSTKGQWIAFETSSITGTGGINIQAVNPDAGLNPSVAKNGKDNQRPNVSGDLLAYESNVSGNYQIYVYRLAEGDTFQVTNSSYDERLNDPLGNLVTYIDDRTGTDLVYVSSLTFVPSQGPAITSVNTAAFQVGQAGSFSVATTGTPAPSIAESGTLPTGITFTDNGNGTGTLGGTPAAAGTFNLIFTAQNGVSPNATQNFTLTVAQAEPTVTFTGAPASAAYNSTFTVATTTDASTTATITASGACSITGNTVTMTSGTGTCTLAASWAADNNYLAASATQSTAATAIAPTVTFTGAPTSAAYQSTFMVATTTSASTTAVITASGACSIAGSTVTMTSGTGTCSLAANWAADNNYSAATLTQSATATKIAPTVTFTGAPTSAAYQSTFPVASTTNASTTAVITASGTCSITGSTVTMTSGTGTCSLAASWAADNNYLAASATQSTTATKIAPTVTFTGAPTSATYQSTFPVASTTNASTTAVLTASGACSIAGSTVTMTSGTGTCSLAASWAADNNYLAGSATQSTTATKIAPAVTFTGAPTSATFQSTFTVASTTNATTTAVITASGACSIAGSTVTMTSGTGTCSLAANWAVDNNYLAASATQSTTATKIAPTVTFTGAPTSAAYQSTFPVASTTNASTTAVLTASGACSIAGNTVTMTSGTGTCSLAASWAADNNYLAASATQFTSATKITPVISWTPASIELGYALGAAQLDATASVPGTFAYNPPLGTVITSSSQTLSVLFTPTNGSDYTTASMSVSLRVTSGPLASVSPASINFGTVDLGTITVKSVAVTNLGTAPMTITDPIISILSGGDSNEFVAVNLCPRSLAAGNSCTIEVIFVAGPNYTLQTATLGVMDNAPGSPQTVALSATVINPKAGTH
jgi:probable HAF family extracellular repeat protein